MISVASGQILYSDNKISVLTDGTPRVSHQPCYWWYLFISAVGNFKFLIMSCKLMSW